MGTFQVQVDGLIATGFESDKARAVLAYLIVEADRPHHRETLSGLLWPELPESAAKNNLRRVLANLRRVTGDHQAAPPYFKITRQSIQFNQDSDHWVDLTDYYQPLEKKTAFRVSIEDLERKVELYRGPFLEGISIAGCVSFDEWMLLVRQRMHQHLLNLIDRLVEKYEQTGEFDKAISYLNQKLELEPWDEAGHRRLMRLLVYTDARLSALAQFETCQRALAEELGVEPSQETIDLYHQILANCLETPPRPPAIFKRRKGK